MSQDGFSPSVTVSAGDPTGDGWRWALPLADYLPPEEPPDDDANDWVIRDIIPRGEPWMLAGEWKCGKTWTAISLAVAVALGEDWLACRNCLGRPGRVLLIALEDNRRRVGKRLWQVLRGLGLSPEDSRVSENLRISDETLRLPGDHLTRLIAELERWRPDVIIVDSLSRVMMGNQNGIEDAAAFTDAWREVGRSTGAAVCFLHHTNKPNPDARRGDPVNRVRGSGELLAMPRHIVVMDGQGDGASSRVTVSGNLEVERRDFVLEYVPQKREDGRVAVTFRQRDFERREGSRAVPGSVIADRRLVALALARDQGCVSGRSLASRLGARKGSTADRVLQELEQGGLLEKAGKAGRRITEPGLAYLMAAGR